MTIQVFIVLLLIFLLYAISIKTVVRVTENTKQTFLFMLFLAKKFGKKESVVKLMRIHFIGEDNKKILNDFINMVRDYRNNIFYSRVKYKDLPEDSHFIIYEGEVFLKAKKYGEIFSIKRGKIGKIDDDEIVEEIRVSFSFAEFMTVLSNYISFTQAFQERFGLGSFQDFIGRVIDEEFPEEEAKKWMKNIS